MKKQFKKIYIEITNICNLSCHFCPKTKRSSKFLTKEEFEKRILEAKPLCDEVTLHLMGDPLIHPRLNDLLNIAKEHDVKINLTTNGTMVENKHQELLNESVKRINFSIHGIKTSFPLEEQKVYLKKVIDFTKIAQEKRPELIITYRLWNVNRESNKDILEKIEKEFDIKLPNNNNQSTQIKNNAFIHFDNAFEWPDPKKGDESHNGFCFGLKTHIGILSDGTVVPCCLDNDGNIPLGNINENTITEILDMPRASNMRKGFQERRLVEDMCKKCPYIKRLKKNS